MAEKDIIGNVTARSGAGRTHSAGAFDIRNVIGALMLVYGAILTVMGVIGNRDNLWVGLGLLLVGVVFVAWARWRPVVVPAEPER